MNFKFTLSDPCC